jgi:hypothetical protein
LWRDWRKRGKKKEIIAGKLHFAVRPTKGVTLTLHVNKSPPQKSVRDSCLVWKSQCALFVVPALAVM